MEIILVAVKTDMQAIEVHHAEQRIGTCLLVKLVQLCKCCPRRASSRAITSKGNHVPIEIYVGGCPNQAEQSEAGHIAAAERLCGEVHGSKAENNADVANVEHCSSQAVRYGEQAQNSCP